MKNEKLKHIATTVLKKANIPEEETFGSMVAILMVISIILTLIRVLQECNKSKLSALPTSKDKYAFYNTEIKHYSVRRGWYTKMRIKKLLRRELNKEQYEKYSLYLINAILDTGENLKDDEIITLVEASNV